MNQIRPAAKSVEGKTLKIKNFYSLNDKIKAYILATNFSPILESYARSCDQKRKVSQQFQVSDDAFERALH